MEEEWRGFRAKKRSIRLRRRRRRRKRGEGRWMEKGYVHLYVGTGQ